MVASAHNQLQLVRLEQIPPAHPERALRVRASENQLAADRGPEDGGGAAAAARDDVEKDLQAPLI